MLDKLRGAAVGEAAIAATDEESALLKSAAPRERPNGQDTWSMPSASQLEGSQKVIASALRSHILCNEKHAAPWIHGAARGAGRNQCGPRTDFCNSESLSRVFYRGVDRSHQATEADHC